MALISVGVILVAFLAELLVSWRRGDGLHAGPSTRTSVKMSLVFMLPSVLLALLVTALLTVVWSHSPLRWSMREPWHWAVLLVLEDFLFYWSHRASHAWRVLWASHQVHHSSERFNLSTGLRNSWVGGFLDWVFFVPMAALGFPPLAIALLQAVTVTWAFLQHAAYLPRLRALEWVIVMPSNHRVHHLRGPAYAHTNFGRVFSVWDRLFGTYLEPVAEARFGMDPMPERPDDLVHLQFRLWADLVRGRRR